MAKQAVSKPNRNSLKGLWGGTMAKQAVSKPNRNSLKGLWGGTMAKQAEGCAVLRLSKAAAGLLRVLRPGQNVPCSSFEAQ